jgi:AraC-like DNA-binding protein
LKTDVSISHIPVVLLTALGGDESSLTGYKMGADLYLSKPFGIDLLMAILTNLFRTRNELKRRYAQPELNLSTREITFSNADERFIDRLVNLIQKRLDDPDMRIDELASEMAMSRSSFYSKVKLVTGMSANAFVTDYKIKQAIQMLRDPDKTIQEIAMQLGFVNQRYFSTVFKQLTGKIPTRYRDELLHR